jgi:hypothetical protein
VRRSRGRAPTVRQIVLGMRNFPSLLRLESDNELGLVSSSIERAIRGGLELASLRSTLCGPSRAGTLLGALCMDSELVSRLQETLNLLAGPTDLSLGRHVGNVKIRTDLSALLVRSPTDLKAFLPTQFNSAGKPVSYPDQTVGGLFPNGDIVEKLQQIGFEAVARD